MWITGDLAMYFQYLGRDGGSTSYCYMCKLSRQTWARDIYMEGEKWSLPLIEECLCRDKAGVKCAPLFTKVPVLIKIVTPEETQAREAYFTSILELESANEELEQWLGNFAQELADKRLERTTLIKDLKKRTLQPAERFAKDNL